MGNNKIKVQKALPHFADEVNGLKVEELNSRLVQLAKDMSATDDAKEADEGLQAAKESAKELGAPYREAKRDIRLKTTYIVELIKEKGGE